MNPYSTSDGKIILLGEHAVVYGYPAIVTGVAPGARARAFASEHASLNVNGSVLVPGHDELSRALDALLSTLGSPRLRIEADIHVPPGIGLGASAALGVAIARAVASLGQTTSLPEAESFERIVAAAQAWETVFHGTPSGIDVTAAALGGCFRFTRGTPPKPLSVTRAIPLVVAAVGPQVSTKWMVGGLAERRAREPERVNPVLESIGRLVDDACRAVETSDHETLGHLMNLNQVRLAEIGLSTPALESACQTARAAGALGAKLTGKGGGGCIVALCRDETTEVLNALRALGIDCFTTTVTPQNRPFDVTTTA